MSHMLVQKALFHLIDGLLGVVGGLFEPGPGAYSQDYVVALAVRAIQHW